MNRLIILPIIILSLPIIADAQMQSIVSASGSSSGNTLQTNWSIGEIFTESFANGTITAISGTNESGVVYVITAISDIDEGYKLYPNPFSTNLTLEVPDKSLDQIFIEIFDINGQVVPVNTFKQLNQVTISPGDITTGVYLVTISTRNKKQSFKIIKK